MMATLIPITNIVVLDAFYKVLENFWLENLFHFIGILFRIWTPSKYIDDLNELLVHAGAAVLPMRQRTLTLMSESENRFLHSSHNR